MKTVLIAIVLIVIAGCGRNAEQRAIAEECKRWSGETVRVTVDGETRDVSCPFMVR